MITITGTCYFPTFNDAVKYYTREWFYGCNKTKMEIVEEKINEGLIYIGAPMLKPGETLFIKDNRYYIQEGN